MHSKASLVTCVEAKKAVSNARPAKENRRFKLKRLKPAVALRERFVKTV